MSNRAVFWPCIFKLHGENELIYLKDRISLQRECDALILTENDYLIDTAGNKFILSDSKSQGINLTKQDEKVTLQQIVQLVQAHQFTLAEVCLTKVHFANIAEAINALKNH